MQQGCSRWRKLTDCSIFIHFLIFILRTYEKCCFVLLTKNWTAGKQQYTGNYFLILQTSTAIQLSMLLKINLLRLETCLRQIIHHNSTPQVLLLYGNAVVSKYCFDNCPCFWYIQNHISSHLSLLLKSSDHWTTGPVRDELQEDSRQSLVQRKSRHILSGIKILHIW